MLAALAGAAMLFAILGSGRAGRAGATFLILAALGCALAWARAEGVGAIRLQRPQIAEFKARIEAADLLAARESTRLTLTPDAGQGLPPHVRVNVSNDDSPAGLAPGQRVQLRARLMPPPAASLPGAYDFARLAWFKGLGATGHALGPVTILDRAEPHGFEGWIAGLRARLTAHVHQSLPGSAGGIAASFVTGDQGAISDADADAMRTSGLAHLLSISGLHVGAVVGGTMLLVLRLLALSPALALRAPLPLIAAAVAALAGIGYTLLAGAEVPTVRSCIAAILVLIALAIGREAMTLRLVAAGAFIVLLFWPEALIGPSFQLSFAAVTALIAFNEYPRVRQFARRREDQGWFVRLARELLVLLLTGIAIEIALAPIGLYHFHRSGLYGAIANIIAIPLTTIVIMPMEALALLFDLVGAGGIFWAIAGLCLRLLITLAHRVSDLPGSVAALPTMPIGAFALMMIAGLWLCLWRTRARLLALPLFLSGAIWATASPAPDLLITGDGRHVAVRGAHGGMFLLRPRAGDYVRDMISAVSADDSLDAIDALPDARCNADICAVTVEGKSQR